MNDLEKYLTSGIIESYCVGNLTTREAAGVSEMAKTHQEVQSEIDRTLAVLEKYPPGPAPSPALKNRVLTFLNQFLEEEKIDLAHPPLIHRHSDAMAWSRALQGLEPQVVESEHSVRVLKMSKETELCVVWLNAEMIEDEHDADEFLESFLILEGACECNFGGKIVRFSAGDYFDIPPGTPHTIKNISENMGFVKGLVQRRKVA